MTHFLNFLSAVATVGAENFTQQSSNIALMNCLSIPELSLNHLEQLQKISKNRVWAPHFGGTLETSGEVVQHFPAIGSKSVVSVTFSDI